MRRIRKKAFLAGALVDVWAILLFVVVIIVFAVLYKWSAETSMQRLQDKKDVTYGNYLSQVYLRTPLSVAGKEMTVAELIALYDYNQTLEREKDRSYAETVRDGVQYIFGKRNPMQEALIELTDEFVEENFDRRKCSVFSIYGNAFEYVRRGASCPGAQAFSLNYLFRQIDWVPEEAYKTYVATVDPRDEPIIIYSIYDFERVLSVYSPDPYFDMSEAERMAVAQNSMAVG